MTTTEPECQHWNFQLCNHWMENLADYRAGNGYVDREHATINTNGSVRILVPAIRLDGATTGSTPAVGTTA